MKVPVRCLQCRAQGIAELAPLTRTVQAFPDGWWMGDLVEEGLTAFWCSDLCFERYRRRHHVAYAQKRA